MEGFIDLKTLNLQELAGVVNIYPWFSLARKELCERMSTMGDWGMSQYAEAAMYMSDRKVLARLLRKMENVDYSDSNVSEMVEKCVRTGIPAMEENGQESADAGNGSEDKARVVVVGGDYFSPAEYEKVRQGRIDIESVFAARSAEDGETGTRGPEYDFCTETLAQIYAEQGYSEQARDIYSKLILAYPEKSVYFAALIEKLEQENQNQ